MATYDVEVTDTFGGEANYCWVRRYTVDGSCSTASHADRKLVRAAKRAAGWSGRTVSTNFGDMIEVRPRDRSVCQIMFITYRDAPASEEVV